VETKQLLSQADVEEWLRSQVAVQAVDPLHVQVRTSVEPHLDLTDEELAAWTQVEQHGYRNGNWWLVDLYARVEVFLPGGDGVPRWLTLGRASKHGVTEGARNGDPHQMVWEDMPETWKELACQAVEEAERALAVLRAVALAWGSPNASTETAAAHRTPESSG
jgi:hypothetical protein